MPKPEHIGLPGGVIIPILYEDRSVLAIDKPPGWMLAPSSWRQTSRNLQALLEAAVRTREFWARSRNLKFLRYIHRLDAETTGVLLLGKTPGVLSALGRLFETRRVEKLYLAVVRGVPKTNEWISREKLTPDPRIKGRMKIDPKDGKEAETHFRVLQTGEQTSLVEAKPLTGRTHQIRVHLASQGHPVLGDYLYEPAAANPEGKYEEHFGLRAIALAYVDPFRSSAVRITAPAAQFVRHFGFELPGKMDF